MKTPSRIAGREFLHSPGPSHIPDRVLAAMHRQPLDLVDGRMQAIAQRCFDGLKDVFRTEGHIFIYASNGHGGWEAALSNICQPGEAVLVPEIGHFSNNWAAHARALGLEVELIESDWRSPIDPVEIERRLRADTGGRIKAVLAVQIETATGVANDLPAIRAAIDAAGHPALLVADVIASLAAMPFEMDAWGVDVAIAASQKALMCPPGLALLAANARATDLSASLPRHQRYWDWTPRLRTDSSSRFNGTMPEHMLFALGEALDLIAQEGLPAIHARHARLAGAVQAAVEAWSGGGEVSLNVADPAQRAVTVTTIRTPEGVADRIRLHARETIGVSIAGGLGRLAGTAFRIGHLGDINEPMILGCLGAVEMAMIELGIRHEPGVRAAIEHLAKARGEVA